VNDLLGDQGLYRIVKPEVDAAVDHHEHTRNYKSSIDPPNPIPLKRLFHTVVNALELPLRTCLHHLDIVSQSCSNVVQGIHEELR
jgi:hypothetical protein